MAYRVFRISVADPEPGERELNGFLGSHRVLAVDQAFVDLGASAYWAFCVDFAPGRSGGETEARIAPKLDYKEILSPEQFALFSRLRDLRKNLAAEEGVPVYSIFTNAQLAAMVERRVDSLAGLREIEGIGPARVDKHGARVLECLGASPPA